MYALNIDSKTGRILSVTSEHFCSKGQPLVDSLPEGDISEYLYKGGKFIHDPVPVPEVKHEPTEIEKLTAKVNKLEATLKKVDTAVKQILGGK